VQPNAVVGVPSCSRRFHWPSCPCPEPAPSSVFVDAAVHSTCRHLFQGNEIFSLGQHSSRIDSSGWLKLPDVRKLFLHHITHGGIDRETLGIVSVLITRQTLKTDCLKRATVVCWVFLPVRWSVKVSRAIAVRFNASSSSRKRANPHQRSPSIREIPALTDRQIRPKTMFFAFTVTFAGFAIILAFYLLCSPLEITFFSIYILYSTSIFIWKYG